ncbi:MAG: HAD hydrolase-like protein [Candidatus Spyradocola sp.]|jgi:arginine decarboxylase
MTIEEMLAAQEGRVSFHMPGHKMRRGAATARDTTELPNTDDLHDPTGPYLALGKRLAKAFGVGVSVPLVGGSTRGVQLMVLCALRPGQTLLLPRNAHLSAWSACALGGIEAVPIPLRYDAENEVSNLDPDDAIACMQAHPEARAILLTRPDYYGRMPEIGRIVDEAHARGMQVLVDEAHGAHLSLLGLDGAGDQGADFWVQSLHKTLPALTPCAVVHARNPAWEPEIRRLHRLLESSSPSSLLLWSMENCLEELEKGGREALGRLAERCTAFLREMCADARFSRTAAFLTAYRVDPTRLVLDVRGTGLSGEEAAARLRQAGVDMEMADDLRVVGIPSIASTESDFAALRAALLDLPRAQAPRQWPSAEPVCGERACSVRQAALGAVRWVPLERAAGGIAAGSIGAYPPGVPFVTPGERLTQAAADALCAARRAGRAIFGANEKGELPMAARRYDAVLFDLDGTLMDTSVGIIRSVQYALRGMGLPDDDLPRIRRFIGPPLHAAFSELYHMEDAQATEAVRLYRERYETTGVYEYEPYPGMADLLRDLHAAGVRLAVCTGKPERFSRILLEREGLLPLLEMLVTPDPSEKTDNKPEMVRTILERLGRNALMVGDRCFDIRGARANGIDSAGILHGFGGEKELRESGATFLVHGAEDLRALLLGEKKEA